MTDSFLPYFLIFAAGVVVILFGAGLALMVLPLL